MNQSSSGRFDALARPDGTQDRRNRQEHAMRLRRELERKYEEEVNYNNDFCIDEKKLVIANDWVRMLEHLRLMANTNWISTLVAQTMQ